MAAVLRVVERHGRGMACVLVSFKCFVRSRFGRGSWPRPGARRISDAAVALLGETVFLPSACSERGGGQSRMLGTRNIAISAISNGRFYSPRYLDPIYYHRFFSCAVDDRNRMDNSRAARAHVSHQRAKASNTTSTIGSTTTRPVYVRSTTSVSLFISDPSWRSVSRSALLKHRTDHEITSSSTLLGPIQATSGRAAARGSALQRPAPPVFVPSRRAAAARRPVPP